MSFFVLINIGKVFSNENKILFKIDKKSYTTVDLDNRKNYINFLGENDNLSYEFILQDFISALVFYQYYIESNNDQNLEKEIDIIFNKIQNENNKKNRNITIASKLSIINNLKIDLIRKKILEEIVNLNKKDIFNENDKDADKLYNYKIKYINIDTSNISELQNNKLIINNFKNINDIEKYLLENNINYFKKNSEITDPNKLDKFLKDKINSNLYFFSKYSGEIKTFIRVSKYFKTYDSLIANIFSIKSSEKIKNEDINCNNLTNKNSSEFKVATKEYKYSTLNKKIQENLIEINDFILIQDNNLFNYIMLCGLSFNKEIFNNVNLNNKINLAVSENEKKFIKKYSERYNLVIIDE